MALMFNPNTGGSGEIPDDRVEEALNDGLKHGMRMSNPATGGNGVIPAERYQEAIADGLQPFENKTEISTAGAVKEGALSTGTIPGWGLPVASGLASTYRKFFGTDEDKAREWSDLYGEHLAIGNQQKQEAQSQHPIAFGAGGVGASLPAAVASAGALGPVVGGAALGGTTGAGTAFTNEVAPSPETVIKNTGLGAGVGAVTGGVGKGLTALGGLASKAGTAIMPKPLAAGQTAVPWADKMTKAGVDTVKGFTQGATATVGGKIGGIAGAVLGMKPGGVLGQKIGSVAEPMIRQGAQKLAPMIPKSLDVMQKGLGYGLRAVGGEANRRGVATGLAGSTLGVQSMMPQSTTNWDSIIDKAVKSGSTPEAFQNILQQNSQQYRDDKKNDVNIDEPRPISPASNDILEFQGKRYKRIGAGQWEVIN